MSYNQDAAHAAIALNALASHPERVTARNLEVAMLGQSAALDLAEALLAHTRSGYGAQAQPRIAETARDPVETLAVLVHGHPRSLTRAPTDVAAEAAASDQDSSRRWADVARYALAARHQWDNSLPATRPRGDSAWALAADAAHIAAAATRHTASIAHVLDDAGRHQEAEAFRQAGISGLPIVATEVLATAAAGDLAPINDPHPPAQVMLIRGPDDLSAAEKRLPRLLRQSPTLSPRSVKIVALEQTRLAAKLAAQVGDAGLRDRLLTLSHAPQVQRLAVAQAGTIHRTEQRPEHQTLELLTATRRHPLRPAEADRIARTLLQTAPDIFDTLHAAARREHTNMRWYIPTPTTAGMLWAVGHTRIDDDLAGLAQTAHTVAVPPEPTLPDAVPAPRDILAALEVNRQRATEPRQQGAPAYHHVHRHSHRRAPAPTLAPANPPDPAHDNRRDSRRNLGPGL